MNTVGAFLAFFFIVFYVAMLAFSVASYVLQALGLYAIAKRRGINKPWLAWIPVGSGWLLGCISDQYQYVAKGQEKSKRKLLLGLGLATVGCSLVLIIAVFALMGSAIMDPAAGMYDEMSVLSLLLPMGGVSLIMSVIAIVYSVFFYIALYDLYNSCDPSNALLYLLLSIFVGVVQPFFVFICRNKDLGMPPRKDQPELPQEPWQQPQEM